MPEKWFDKMHTISSYEEDGSAMGRLNSWAFAINLAKDNPLTGGGYETFSSALFEVYAPIAQSRDAHSIYFEVLGEHGFVGLFLFLLLMLLAWRTGSWIIRNTKGYQDLMWASDLARMVHVSLVGYAVAGMFLGLAYFDLYYILIAILVVTRRLVGEEIAQQSVERDSAETIRSTSPSGISSGAESPR